MRGFIHFRQTKRRENILTLAFASLACLARVLLFLWQDGSSHPHTSVRGKSDIWRPGFRRKRLMERDYGISLAEDAENAEKSQQDDARSAGAWSRRESRTISVPLFFVRSARSPREIP